MYVSDRNYVPKETYDMWVVATKEILGILLMRQEDLAEVLGTSRVAISQRLNRKSKRLRRLDYLASLTAFRKLTRMSSRSKAIKDAVYSIIADMEEEI